MRLEVVMLLEEAAMRLTEKLPLLDNLLDDGRVPINSEGLQIYNNPDLPQEDEYEDGLVLKSFYEHSKDTRSKFKKKKTINPNREDHTVYLKNMEISIIQWTCTSLWFDTVELGGLQEHGA
ncbi:hypothetical protein PIB30_089772 [Stylosanthes scabra]|uniref:Uncharacterized protein n=1 Tax=Stylosanthes scabra TaxID=79078 RepID=A0ABU6QWI8_9FABA|nr:hypothetical protein [Stylosanthes scabra]